MAEYADRKPWELEPHYCKHVNAMTVEKLHAKSAIAAELAFRDMEIARLNRLTESMQRQLAETTAYYIREREKQG